MRFWERKTSAKFRIGDQFAEKFRERGSNFIIRQHKIVKHTGSRRKRSLQRTYLFIQLIEEMKSRD